MPYPDIDLGSIKGSSADVFPREIAEFVMPDTSTGLYSAGAFHKAFHARLVANFLPLA